MKAARRHVHKLSFSHSFKGFMACPSPALSQGFRTLNQCVCHCVCHCIVCGQHLTVGQMAMQQSTITDVIRNRKALPILVLCYQYSLNLEFPRRLSAGGDFIISMGVREVTVPWSGKQQRSFLRNGTMCCAHKSGFLDLSFLPPPPVHHTKQQ